jgi:hypothetical protein
MSQLEWIAYLTAPQRAVFLDSLQAAIAERGLEARVEGGLVIIGDASVALTGLAAACAGVGASEYRAVLDARLDDLLVSFRDSATSASLDADWQAARSHIKLRIFPTEQADDNADILVSAEIGGGLSVVLVYDLPDTIASVQPDAVVGWPVTGQELWRIATDNIRAEDPPPTVERIALTQAADALLVSSDSFFVTSRLLILGDILPPASFPYGALVIIPHRHAMIVHPITGSDIYDALTALSIMAAEQYTTMPGPMSPDVYWWQGSAIERVAVTVNEEAAEVTVEPSEEFGELLDWLLREDEE